MINLFKHIKTFSEPSCLEESYVSIVIYSAFSINLPLISVAQNKQTDVEMWIQLIYDLCLCLSVEKIGKNEREMKT